MFTVVIIDKISNCSSLMVAKLRVNQLHFIHSTEGQIEVVTVRLRKFVHLHKRILIMAQLDGF